MDEPMLPDVPVVPVAVVPLVSEPMLPVAAPGVLPGGLTAGDVVAFGSIAGVLVPLPLVLGCIG